MTARAGVPAAATREESWGSVDLPRRLAAETLGTALLLAIVVGSAIMGDRLSDGNVALALLANSIATGAGLVVIVTVLGPISGAHLNPVVTLAFALRGEIRGGAAALYVAAQACGAVGGVWIAHLMFAEPLLQLSGTTREGWPQAFAEGVATFGLILAILGTLGTRPAATPGIVGLYIAAAYWFTASTSFANPAVTLARAITDSFAGIAPASVPVFVLAQIAGATLAVAFAAWLFGPRSSGRVASG